MSALESHGHTQPSGGLIVPPITNSTSSGFPFDNHDTNHTQAANQAKLQQRQKVVMEQHYKTTGVGVTQPPSPIGHYGLGPSAFPQQQQSGLDDAMAGAAAAAGRNPQQQQQYLLHQHGQNIQRLHLQQQQQQRRNALQQQQQHQQQQSHLQQLTNPTTVPSYQSHERQATFNQMLQPNDFGGAGAIGNAVPSSTEQSLAHMQILRQQQGQLQAQQAGQQPQHQQPPDAYRQQARLVGANPSVSNP